MAGATPTKWNTVYTRLPYAQYRSLAKHAKADGVTHAAFIRAAIEKELDSRAKKALSRSKRNQPPKGDT